jgi:hypothetical protein
MSIPSKETDQKSISKFLLLKQKNSPSELFFLRKYLTLSNVLFIHPFTDVVMHFVMA